MITKLNLKHTLPVAGIVCFSLASCWTLYSLFNTYAQHPSQLYWAPAVLVELVTAYLVYMSVDLIHRLTRSNSSKQDKRFYAIVLAIFLALAIPTLGASVWANVWQFNNLALAALFPSASIICAVAASLPDSVARYESHRQQEKELARKTREINRKAKEDARKQAEAQQEMNRKAQEETRKMQEESRKEQEEKTRLVAQLGAAGKVYEAFQEFPGATQQEVADLLGVTDRAVRYHLNTLEDAGLIERNGKGLQVVG